MKIQSVVHRRVAMTLTAVAVACGVAAAVATPASAGEPGECDPLCGIIDNTGAVAIGVFNSLDRPVPGYPDTDDWEHYARTHPQTASAIWDYWSTHTDPDGMTAKLLPSHADSQSLGPRFEDTDGFYLGPGMRAIVDVPDISHTCVIGPTYFKVSSLSPTVSVYAGPSVC
ncbi:hypothetical protein [Nocardia sp. NPDC052112]|uniref:hypothetical protein n=1 Tax=Nocardia sp. NPDC052112 TaxID=3155646 RepID=UPI003437A537